MKALESGGAASTIRYLALPYLTAHHNAYAALPDVGLLASISS